MRLLLLHMQGLQSAVNYTCYVAGRDDQSQPNYASPATLLNVSAHYTCGITACADSLLRASLAEHLIACC